MHTLNRYIGISCFSYKRIHTTLLSYHFMASATRFCTASLARQTLVQQFHGFLVHTYYTDANSSCSSRQSTNKFTRLVHNTHPHKSFDQWVVYILYHKYMRNCHKDSNIPVYSHSIPLYYTHWHLKDNQWLTIACILEGELSWSYPFMIKGCCSQKLIN